MTRRRSGSRTRTVATTPPCPLRPWTKSPWPPRSTCGPVRRTSGLPGYGCEPSLAEPAAVGAELVENLVEPVDLVLELIARGMPERAERVRERVGDHRQLAALVCRALRESEDEVVD